MRNISRRSLLRGSVSLAAASTLGCPYVANAAAKTATVWWVQGFVKEEDTSFNAMVADYEKASGNTIDHSLVPFAPLVSAETIFCISGANGTRLWSMVLPLAFS